jgi:hypothetical protein
MDYAWVEPPALLNPCWSLPEDLSAPVEDLMRLIEALRASGGVQSTDNVVICKEYENLCEIV